MNVMTNCNMQMSFQTQTLSNQLMLQSQNIALQQQQLSNINTTCDLLYVPMQVSTVVNPFNQDFNIFIPKTSEQPANVLSETFYR